MSRFFTCCTLFTFSLFAFGCSEDGADSSGDETAGAESGATTGLDPEPEPGEPDPDDPEPEPEPMIEPCSFEETNLWGNVFFTDTFRAGEIKIQFVSTLADINVRYVNSGVQAEECGEWFETTNFALADVVVREVTVLPDIKVCTIGDSCSAALLPGLTSNTSLPK